MRKIAKVNDIINRGKMTIHANKCGCITVDILRLGSKETAGPLDFIPAKANHHSAKFTAIGFAQFNFLTLLKINRHTAFSFT